MLPEYLLFIDTETTGLPGRWDLPYAAPGAAWPHVAQVAWQVFGPDGVLVKEENHYLQVPEGSMSARALAVHGLTPAFLRARGQEPRQVLERLLHDLQTFRPRVVGYFLQLDFHVLGAGFWRAGLPNLLPGLPQFCVMRVTERPADGTHRRYQRLAELHEQLLGLPLPGLHDAREDAAATARCFFELRRRGRIPARTLAGQPPLHEPAPRPAGRGPGQRGRAGWVVLAACVLVLLLGFLGWLLYG